MTLQLVGETNPLADYVQAILDKTGGMPLYIEMLVDFFRHRPGIGAVMGGDVADLVNSMNFQQVRKNVVIDVRGHHRPYDVLAALYPPHAGHH